MGLVLGGNRCLWLLPVLDAHLEELDLTVSRTEMAKVYSLLLKEVRVHGMRFHVRQRCSDRREGRDLCVHACVCTRLCIRVDLCWRRMSGEWFLSRLKTETLKFQRYLYFHLFPFGEARKRIKYL